MSNPRESVLVVEDDSLLQVLFTRVLELAGFAVSVAADGEVALAMVAGERFSVVLMDGNIPKVSGIDVIRRMRAEPSTAGVPVIMVTGSADASKQAEGMGAGANDYLVKPVDVEELVQRVKAQLRSRAPWQAAFYSAREERQRLTDDLVAQGGEAAPTNSARAMCRVLSSLEGLRRVTIYHLPAPGIVIPLADDGTCPRSTVVGRPLPPPLAAQLEARLEKSPPLSVQVEHTGGSEDILVSLGPPGRHFGALRFEVEAGGPAVVAAHMRRAAALELGAVIGGLLQPGLEASDQRAALGRAVLERLHGGGVSVSFQRIVGVQSGEPVGYEGLSRPADGMPIESFLAQSAMGGVLEEVECDLAGRVVASEAGLGLPGWISVNLSPSTLASASVLDVLHQATRPIVIDLSDKALGGDLSSVGDLVSVGDLASLGDMVRAAGFAIALDDTGVGYSSMRTIAELRPEYVKLDRDWVWGLNTDPARRAMVGAVVSFAKGEGCHVIAEGVETPGELESLAALGVDFAQGHLFGPEETLSPEP